MAKNGTKARKATPKKKEATAERIIKAIHVSQGLITIAAAKAHVNPCTIHRYIKDNPEVAKAVEDAKEKLYDMVESKLFNKIKANDMTAIIFFAKTRMKHRGYIEKHEVEFPKDITLRVVYDDPGNSKNN